MCGAFSLSGLGIIFPSIIELCALYPNRDYGPGNIQLFKNFVLIVIGFAGLFIGSGSSLVNIIKKLQMNGTDTS